jgi:hypothetical protein
MVQKRTRHAGVSIFAHEPIDDLGKQFFCGIKILLFDGFLGFAEFLFAAD